MSIVQLYRDTFGPYWGRQWGQDYAPIPNERIPQMSTAIRDRAVKIWTPGDIEAAPLRFMLKPSSYISRGFDVLLVKEDGASQFALLSIGQGGVMRHALKATTVADSFALDAAGNIVDTIAAQEIDRLRSKINQAAAA